MKINLISLAAGLLVGVICGLIQVRSPAPPVVALTGLFGILLGAQALPIARNIILGGGVTVACCAEPWPEQALGERRQHRRKPNAEHRADPR